MTFCGGFRLLEICSDHFKCNPMPSGEVASVDSFKPGFVYRVEGILVKYLMMSACFVHSYTLLLCWVRVARVGGMD